MHKASFCEEHLLPKTSMSMHNNNFKIEERRNPLNGC